MPNQQNELTSIEHKSHQGNYAFCSKCSLNSKISRQPGGKCETAIFQESHVLNLYKNVSKEIKCFDELNSQEKLNQFYQQSEQKVEVSSSHRKSNNTDQHHHVRSQSNINGNIDKVVVSTSEDEPKVEGLGLAGFIIGTLGLFMPLGLGLIMCLLAIIFGAISLAKINQNPDVYKGAGFAITSLVVGIVGVGLILLVLLLMA